MITARPAACDCKWLHYAHYNSSCTHNKTAEHQTQICRSELNSVSTMLRAELRSQAQLRLAVVLKFLCLSVLMFLCPTVLVFLCPTVLVFLCPTVLVFLCPAVLVSHCLCVPVSYCPYAPVSYSPCVPVFYCPYVPVS